MQTWCATSQLVGIKWFGEAGMVFAACFIGHLCEDVLGPSEEVIPASLRLEFGKNPCGEGLLLLFGEFGSFLHRFLEQRRHGDDDFTTFPSTQRSIGWGLSGQLDVLTRSSRQPARRLRARFLLRR